MANPALLAGNGVVFTRGGTCKEKAHAHGRTVSLTMRLRCSQTMPCTSRRRLMTHPVVAMRFVSIGRRYPDLRRTPRSRVACLQCQVPPSLTGKRGSDVSRVARKLNRTGSLSSSSIAPVYAPLSGSGATAEKPEASQAGKVWADSLAGGDTTCGFAAVDVFREFGTTAITPCIS